MPYIKYTQRLPIVQEFTPEESEDRLYNLVSEYLQRDNLEALPPSQRSLMTLGPTQASGILHLRHCGRFSFNVQQT